MTTETSNETPTEVIKEWGTGYVPARVPEGINELLLVRLHRIPDKVYKEGEKPTVRYVAEFEKTINGSAQVLGYPFDYVKPTAGNRFGKLLLACGFCQDKDVPDLYRLVGKRVMALVSDYSREHEGKTFVESRIDRLKPAQEVMQ